MLIDEMSHNFQRKNNNYNYSHCPLKKRPVFYTSENEEGTPEVIKGKSLVTRLFITWKKIAI